MTNQLTIYVLAYNRPDYLRQCLQSIANQTRRDFHVVVLDNASTMDLRSVVDAVGSLDVRYLRHPKNIQSIGNFRHAWYETKDTPFFMIFHDDDVMHPQFVARAMELIDHPSDPVWAGGSSLGFKGEPPPFPALAGSTPAHLTAAELAHGLLTGRSNIVFSTVIYRSARVATVDLDALIREHSIIFDRPLLFALAEQGRCAVSPLPLVLYRCHPAQDSKTGPMNEDNLLALFTTYRRILRPIWNEQVAHDFYRWSGFEIPNYYWLLSPGKRSPFGSYLRKARNLNVYRDRLLLRFFVGRVRHFISRLRRIPAKMKHVIGAASKQLSAA